MEFLEQLKTYVPCNEQEENDKRSILRLASVFDDLYTRENETAHFTASSWIINKDRTKVLMIYHNIYNSWAWTGGHADGDKDLLYVACKEAKEETGIVNVCPLLESPLAVDVLNVVGHIKRGKYISDHLHLNATYLLEADDSEELVIKPDENSGVKWVPIEEAPELSAEAAMRVVYRKLNKKIKELGLY